MIMDFASSEHFCAICKCERSPDHEEGWDHDFNYFIMWMRLSNSIESVRKKIGLHILVEFMNNSDKKLVLVEDTARYNLDVTLADLKDLGSPFKFKVVIYNKSQETMCISNRTKFNDEMTLIDTDPRTAHVNEFNIDAGGTYSSLVVSLPIDEQIPGKYSIPFGFLLRKGEMIFPQLKIISVCIRASGEKISSVKNENKEGPSVNMRSSITKPKIMKNHDEREIVNKNAITCEKKETKEFKELKKIRELAKTGLCANNFATFFYHCLIFEESAELLGKKDLSEISFSLPMSRMLDSVRYIGKGAQILRLFPDQRPFRFYTTSYILNNEEFFDYRLALNAQQRTAVDNILNSTSEEAPYIVTGPPGSGKTAVMIEAICQILKKTDKTMLVCAPGNVQCDILAVKLAQYCEPTEMLRVNSFWRRKKSIPQEIQKYTNLSQSGRYFTKVTANKLKEYRIVISTLIHIGKFHETSYRPDFVFIDEASQAIEPEVCIPFPLLAWRGTIILAGNPKQLKPVVCNEEAKKCGLDISLLQRLVDTQDLYKKNNPMFITRLRTQYRCHPTILKVTSGLTSDSELEDSYAPAAAILDPISKINIFPYTKDTPVEEPNPCNGVAVEFCSVNSAAKKQGASKSYYNLDEVFMVISYIKAILKISIEPKISKSDIGIISPYAKQVLKIKEALLKNNIDKIDVGTVEYFQGREKRIIIMSTVRGEYEFLKRDFRYQMGFMSQTERFNVAITRAVSKIIVIGCPIVLSMDANWGKYISTCQKLNSCYGMKPLKRDTWTYLNKMLEITDNGSEYIMHSLLLYADEAFCMSCGGVYSGAEDPFPTRDRYLTPYSIEHLTSYGADVQKWGTSQFLKSVAKYDKPYCSRCPVTKYSLLWSKGIDPSAVPSKDSVSTSSEFELVPYEENVIAQQPSSTLIKKIVQFDVPFCSRCPSTKYSLLFSAVPSKDGVSTSPGLEVVKYEEIEQQPGIILHKTTVKFDKPYCSRCEVPSKDGIAEQPGSILHNSAPENEESDEKIKQHVPEVSSGESSPDDRDSTPLPTADSVSTPEPDAMTQQPSQKLTKSTFESKWTKHPWRLHPSAVPSKKSVSTSSELEVVTTEENGIAEYPRSILLYSAPENEESDEKIKQHVPEVSSGESSPDDGDSTPLPTVDSVSTPEPDAMTQQPSQKLTKSTFESKWTKHPWRLHPSAVPSKKSVSTSSELEVVTTEENGIAEYPRSILLYSAPENEESDEKIKQHVPEVSSGESSPDDGDSTPLPTVDSVSTPEPDAMTQQPSQKLTKSTFESKWTKHPWRLHPSAVPSKKSVSTSSELEVVTTEENGIAEYPRSILLYSAPENEESDEKIKQHVLEISSGESSSDDGDSTPLPTVDSVSTPEPDAMTQQPSQKLTDSTTVIEESDTKIKQHAPEVSNGESSSDDDDFVDCVSTPVLEVMTQQPSQKLTDTLSKLSITDEVITSQGNDVVQQPSPILLESPLAIVDEESDGKMKQNVPVLSDAERRAKLESYVLRLSKAIGPYILKRQRQLEQMSKHLYPSLFREAESVKKMEQHVSEVSNGESSSHDVDSAPLPTVDSVSTPEPNAMTQQSSQISTDSPLVIRDAESDQKMEQHVSEVSDGESSSNDDDSAPLSTVDSVSTPEAEATTQQTSQILTESPLAIVDEESDEKMEQNVPELSDSESSSDDGDSTPLLTVDSVSTPEFEAMTQQPIQISTESPLAIVDEESDQKMEQNVPELSDSESSSDDGDSTPLLTVDSVSTPELEAMTQQPIQISTESPLAIVDEESDQKMEQNVPELSDSESSSDDGDSTPLLTVDSVSTPELEAMTQQPIQISTESPLVIVDEESDQKMEQNVPELSDSESSSDDGDSTPLLTVDSVSTPELEAMTQQPIQISTESPLAIVDEESDQKMEQNVPELSDSECSSDDGDSTPLLTVDSVSTPELEAMTQQPIQISTESPLAIVDEESDQKMEQNVPELSDSESSSDDGDSTPLLTVDSVSTPELEAMTQQPIQISTESPLAIVDEESDQKMEQNVPELSDSESSSDDGDSTPLLTVDSVSTPELEAMKQFPFPISTIIPVEPIGSGSDSDGCSSFEVLSSPSDSDESFVLVDNESL